MGVAGVWCDMNEPAMFVRGDNSSWWEHLWMSMPQLQNLGLSGIAWCGVDVGGFFDDCTGELLARWTEFGAFQPFCRNHSAMGTARQEFLFGHALLVAPITRPGVEYRHVYLPAGAWAHWWTGEIIEGPAHVLAHAPLGRPALYARVNTPIPMWPVLQHTDEVPDALTWRVFVGRGSGSGSLYEDSGDGDGPSCRRLRM